jgi:iron(III) transport system substrate-binding protein
MTRRARTITGMMIAAGLATGVAMKNPGDELFVYCGRGEDLIRPLVEQFQKKHGIKLRIRYGGTAELAATILEEGKRSPADLFLAQDAGALGALAHHGRLAALPEDILQQVPARFRSREATWVGISGRARVVVYNTSKIKPADLPADLFGFCDAAWKGRIGWAPENGSFQSFVTALILREGRERALAWLKGIQANEPRVFGKNSAIVAAVAAGEIDAGFVNHYYLHTAQRSQPDIPAANYFFPGESAGSLINVAGIGMLASSTRQAEAELFIRFLLQETSQRYFLEQTYEYPAIESLPAGDTLTPLNMVPALDIDLNDLNNLEATLQLMHEAGIL